MPVRLITDETEYRNPDRLWDAYNVDMMYHAGVQVRLDGHQGIDHEKGVILLRPGPVDLRLVELDVAVDRLAARAQLLHHASRGSSTG